MANDLESPEAQARRAREGVIMQLLTPEGRQSVFVPFKEIRFGFTPQSLVTDPPRIEAPWIASPSIRGDNIHVRTPMGVLRTKWRKIEDVIADLTTVLLHRTHHGTFANLNLIGAPELEARLERPRLGYRIKPAYGAPTWEWVHVSRSERKRIDQILGC